MSFAKFYFFLSFSCQRKFNLSYPYFLWQQFNYQILLCLVVKKKLLVQHLVITLSDGVAWHVHFFSFSLAFYSFFICIFFSFSVFFFLYVFLLFSSAIKLQNLFLIYHQINFSFDVQILF